MWFSEDSVISEVMGKKGSVCLVLWVVSVINNNAWQWLVVGCWVQCSSSTKQAPLTACAAHGPFLETLVLN